MRVVESGLDDVRVVALLEAHVAELRATSPPESTHVLDLDGLRAAGVRFFTARDGDEPVGCAAVAPLEPGHVELKSMRTASGHTGRGVGALLVTHVLDAVRAAGVARVSLETGSDDFFAPARRLYARHGFVECPPFGRYRPDPNSTFMTRTL
ncbi:GNAT family N-acetyltransferase [Nocardioides marinquilinus]|uniref:GNAT family N-acetyltransferase n=1 Tax=Nocardioides marinquilinus TaxID=1210400 RepID=A0ABP9PUE1_9ACTN